jgi:hypothetical protein
LTKDTKNDLPGRIYVGVNRGFRFALPRERNRAFLFRARDQDVIANQTSGCGRMLRVLQSDVILLALIVNRRNQFIRG